MVTAFSNTCSGRRFSQAFTLVELLTVLAIVAVLLSATATHVKTLADRHVEADIKAFATLIQTARHTAIMRGARVILCPGDTEGCGQRNQWHLGTILFTDQNLNRRIDPEDELLRITTFRSRIVWRSFRNRSYLVFVPRGFTDWQNGHFQFCSHTGEEAPRQLILNAAGRLYFSRDANLDGIHEDARGRPIRCA